MNHRAIILLAIGFGLSAASHSLELRGDAAPFAASGVSTERAIWHIAALLMLLAGLGCFIAAAISFFRKKAR